LKGGIGSASAVTADGFTVGALAAVNAAGSAVIARGPRVLAAPFGRGGEVGGPGPPPAMPARALRLRTHARPRRSTTWVVVATDAVLTKSQAKRLAVMAQTGLARAIYPVHAPLDGDVVFAAATSRKPLTDPLRAFSELGALAANTVARAVARGVYE